MHYLFEDFVLARDLGNEIKANFPEGYEIMVDELVEKVNPESKHKALSTFIQTLSFSMIQQEDYYTKTEINYFRAVREYALEVRKGLGRIEKKSRLTPEQEAKYAEKPKEPKEPRPEVKPEKLTTKIDHEKTSWNMFAAGIVVGTVFTLSVIAAFAWL